MTVAHILMFLALTGIYEPSAIQQLPDGRFLVVEDEKTQPFSLVTIRADGTVASSPLVTATPDNNSDFKKLDDLEGLAIDTAGFIYAITSHSRNNAGAVKKSREKLVRFRIEGDRAVAPVVVTELKAALSAAHPVLATAAAVRDVKADGGLNIEALEMTPDRQRLLIGFRSPLLDRRAIIASIENPVAVFEKGEAPRIAPRLVMLDLGGHGIRGLSYVPALAGYLVVSGPVAKEQVQFQLWFWSGQATERPRRVSVPGLPGFEHAEGVSPAIIDGRQRIIIVSDDGSRKDQRFARYLLLDPEQLQIAP
ncbi:MAG: DUF3616 domain-containing protein [Gammaproteobacteria bacterium]|nr:DUF3616 domain-containing protein [Rhodocyclaceae bacterium]MBU3910038.1 DUF3616 domain-containing protein [Gammaproteobacteria bacterium]MBU3990523.1 DUF3616 domain-containing protein [Gammaproteobacteria bacterium]MBU4004011.1 DUF3616 domain-containing protein [Gammaproteobacteria bacterium]MBU4020258.1 DUF3616 domain-containing protein [Gammaproteobacteria bacterium]